MSDRQDLGRKLEALQTTVDQIRQSLSLGVLKQAGVAAAPSASGSVQGSRTLVYVHGICNHTAGFSDSWWQALRPYTSAFAAGNLGDTRREVIWSDVLRQHHGDAASARAAVVGSIGEPARDAMEQLELAARIQGVLLERMAAQAAAFEPGLSLGSGGGQLGAGISIPTLPFGDCINDFVQYMLRDDVRRQILAKFTAVVEPLLQAGTPIDIISHSWGTVVAYEGLRELATRIGSATCLNWFTVGCALSIEPVKLSLRQENRDGRKPGVVRRWINLNAAGDVIGGDIKGHPFAVDAQFLDLPAVGCSGIAPACAHGSYFVVNNVAVNRDIFASYINSSVPAESALSPAASIPTMGLQAEEEQTLDQFLAQAATLTVDQRQQIVAEALRLVEGCYVHLPMKRAMHAEDPVQSLKLLQIDVPQISDDLEFHERLLLIFNQLRDLHTNYILPTPYSRKFAYLPFRIERFWKPDQPNKPGYMVTRIDGPSPDPSFKQGVVVTRWNGMTIERAIEVNGDREAGSNREARRARGLENLTVRWLGMSLPPDEQWVIVGYTDESGQSREARFLWKLGDAASVSDLTKDALSAMGVSLLTEMERRFRRRMFAMDAIEKARRLAAIELPAFRTSDSEMLPAMAAHLGAVTRALKGSGADPATTSTLTDVFKEFGSVQSPEGTFGYIRIAAFASEERTNATAHDFIAEFLRIVSHLPQNGLIIDVRGNGGGYIEWGERLLQLLTPGQIQPEPFQFINTPLTLKLTESDAELQPWSASIERSTQTSELFSQSAPLTPPDSCNDIGQRYQGPVVLIVDAQCYSTTDIFAAGFEDHGVGTIIGTDLVTGAGGANVWDLQYLMTETDQFPADMRFVQLPNESSMRVAIRRSTRVGQNAGMLLEELGVAIKPELFHEMTAKDILGNNEDLKARACKELGKMSAYSLRGEIVRSPKNILELHISSSNIDRIDIYIGDRPLSSVNVTNASFVIELPADFSAGSVVNLYGYLKGNFVAACRTQWSAGGAGQGGGGPGGGGPGDGAPGGAPAGAGGGGEGQVQIVPPEGYVDVSEYTFEDHDRRAVVSSPSLGTPDKTIEQAAAEQRDRITDYFKLDENHTPTVSSVVDRGDGTKYVMLLAHIPDEHGTVLQQQAFVHFASGQKALLSLTTRNDDLEAVDTFKGMINSAQPSAAQPAGAAKAGDLQPAHVLHQFSTSAQPSRQAGRITVQLPSRYRDRTVTRLRNEAGSQLTVTVRDPFSTSAMAAAAAAPAKASPFTTEPAGVNLWRERPRSPKTFDAATAGKSPGAGSGAKAPDDITSAHFTFAGKDVSVHSTSAGAAAEPALVDRIADQIQNGIR